MHLIRSLDHLTKPLGPLVATIGNFDGVHCGHRWVIDRVRARARALDTPSAVITFDPHPARALRPEQPRPLITPLERKIELLEATGVDLLIVLPFSDVLARMSAREFAEDILSNRLGVRELHEGENFRFGRGAEAGLATLTELGVELGFTVQGYAPEHARGGIVSSSRIRDLITAGDLDSARHLLGRSFAIDSHPASGRGYGTRYTVPTINLAPYPELLPANGVYVTRLRVGDDSPGASPAARWFEAVTNVGNRPTFGADSFAVESFLLDFDSVRQPLSLTEQTPLRLEFLKHLRPEQQWPSPDALKLQIGRDVSRAHRFLSLLRLLQGAPRPS